VRELARVKAKLKYLIFIVAPTPVGTRKRERPRFLSAARIRLWPAEVAADDDSRRGNMISDTNTFTVFIGDPTTMA
jgi:hypothetical protein